MSLFGVDIASIVTDAFSGQLKQVTITRETPGEYDPVTDTTTGGTTEVFESEGIEENRQKMLSEGLINDDETPILIIAQPLETSPKNGDRISIDGQTYTISGIIGRDPAGATWTVRAKT